MSLTVNRPYRVVAVIPQSPYGKEINFLVADRDTAEDLLYRFHKLRLMARIEYEDIPVGDDLDHAEQVVIAALKQAAKRQEDLFFEQQRRKEQAGA